MKHLLFQIRDADDPIGSQEQDVFLNALDCDPGELEIFDLLSGSPTDAMINAADIVVIGGSGNYSTIGEEPWLLAAFETIRRLYEIGKPTFAICWGCQAVARALGGETIHDPDNGELGVAMVAATEAANDDALFRPLGGKYAVFQGHEDRVSRLPKDAVLLASTADVPYQAFTFADRPIYATQFHPELTRAVFLERVQRYPHYVERITGKPYAEFEQSCGDALGANQLLRRFAEQTATVG